MERFAIYYMPPAQDPLGEFGCSVLGRDADTGATTGFPTSLANRLDDWPKMTEAPRRYGFHATLKAPFRLIGGTTEAEFIDAVARFAAQCEPVPLPRLRVAHLGQFIALIPTQSAVSIERFVENVVTTFDRFRSPLTSADRDRHLQAPLSPHQIELLDTWGYPYVMDEFRFHMTLTGKLADAEREPACRILAELLEGVSQPAAINALTIAKQPEPGEPFHIVGRYSLAG